MSTAVITQPTGPAAGFGLLMSPQTIEQVQAFCKMLAATEFVPKAFRGKPDSIMVVGAMGARLGVDVFSAMAGIADINGRPSVWGDLLLAVCMNNPHFEDCLESYEGKPYEDTFRAVCVAKRKGREPVVRSFSVIEAKEAGLWKKEGPWSKTPQRQMQMRARAFALRDTFADTLAGFKMAEEMMDAEPIDVTATATVHDTPRPGKVRAVKADKEAEKVPAADAPKETTTEWRPEDANQVAASTATEPKAEAPPLESHPVTIADCVTQATALFKTEDGKRLLKDHLKAWKVEKVQELGELPDEEIARYFHKLEEIVALHIKLHGALK